MLNKALSVIIINYKSESFLGNCLASLYRKIDTRLLFEVIIFNNDPAEKLEAIQQKFSDIKIIPSTCNIGFGAGANAAAKEATGELLFFLNPDAEIFTDNITAVLEKFESDPRLGALGGDVLTPDGKKQKWSAGYETTLLDLIRNNFQLPRSRRIWESRDACQAHWVSGSSLFVRNEIFQRIGGFDENIFMYFEDMDLCKRIRQSGHTILFFPPFSICHAGGRSYDDEARKKRDYYASQDYFFRKHRTVPERVALKILRKIFLPK
jgi:GT2 family glycosyltransferase